MPTYSKNTMPIYKTSQNEIYKEISKKRDYIERISHLTCETSACKFDLGMFSGKTFLVWEMSSTNLRGSTLPG